MGACLAIPLTPRVRGARAGDMVYPRTPYDPASKQGRFCESPIVVCCDGSIDFASFVRSQTLEFERPAGSLGSGSLILGAPVALWWVEKDPANYRPCSQLGEAANEQGYRVGTRIVHFYVGIYVQSSAIALDAWRHGNVTLLDLPVRGQLHINTAPGTDWAVTESSVDMFLRRLERTNLELMRHWQAVPLHIGPPFTTVVETRFTDFRVEGKYLRGCFEPESGIMEPGTLSYLMLFIFRRLHIPGGTEPGWRPETSDAGDFHFGFYRTRRRESGTIIGNATHMWRVLPRDHFYFGPVPRPELNIFYFGPRDFECIARLNVSVGRNMLGLTGPPGRVAGCHCACATLSCPMCRSM